MKKRRSFGFDAAPEMVAEALAHLTPESHATALELLELPDVIRGYEEIKLRNVALFRKRAQPLRKRLTRA